MTLEIATDYLFELNDLFYVLYDARGFLELTVEK